MVIGHRLGLYRALACGPATAEQLAERTGTAPRYIAEWLRGQAAGGYITWDAAEDRYSLTEEQAFVLANPDGAVYAPGAFVLALGALRAEERIADAFRSGAGLGWHEHDQSVFTGCEQFFRPGAFVLALGALRAEERIAGSDYHDRSIELARKRGTDAGIADRVTFEVAGAGSSPDPATTWPRPSTACTTWETRSGRAGTSARPLSRTAAGWSSSRTPPTSPRAT